MFALLGSVCKERNKAMVFLETLLPVQSSYPSYINNQHAEHFAFELTNMLNSMKNKPNSSRLKKNQHTKKNQAQIVCHKQDSCTEWGISKILEPLPFDHDEVELGVGKMLCPVKYLRC